MLNSEWPTHILHSNIKDTDYCQEVFHYLISTYGDEWPNSFSQKDIFSHTDHKNPIFDKAQRYIESNVEQFFQTVFQILFSLL